jgi:hypothetical protein
LQDHISTNDWVHSTEGNTNKKDQGLGQPWHKARPYLKNNQRLKKKKRASRVAQVVKHLPGQCKALSLIPSTIPLAPPHTKNLSRMAPLLITDEGREGGGGESIGTSEQTKMKVCCRSLGIHRWDGLVLLGKETSWKVPKGCDA